jgi:HEAT repeat protein
MASSQSLDGNANVDTLAAALSSEDAIKRETARDTLVAIGSNEVIAALVAELADPRDHVRWEAVKALSSLVDPVSTPALVNALDDDNPDVRWVAGEGLIALGRIGVLAVLHALTKRASSVTFRESASHVLHGCEQLGYARALEPVLAALADWEPGGAAPPAAYDALLVLKVGGTCQKA